MEVVRLCLVVAETRRLRPVRPPCGRPLYSSCGIIRHGASCPFTDRLRPPCTQGLGYMEVSTFVTDPFAPLFCFQCSGWRAAKGTACTRKCHRRTSLVETHLVGGTGGGVGPCRLSGECRMVN